MEHAVTARVAPRAARRQLAGSSFPWTFSAGLLAGISAASVGVEVGPAPAGTLSMLTMASAALIVFLRFTPAEIGGIRLGAIDLLFAIFIAARLASELANASELRHPVFSGTLLLPVVAYAGFALARQSVMSAEQAVLFLRGLSLPAVGVSLLAVLQVLRLPEATQFITTFVSAAGYERRLELGWAVRGTSTVGHHTALGGYLVCIAAAACLDLLISRRLTGKIARTPVLILLIVLVGQITTFTFATIALSLLIGLITLLMLGLRPLLTVLLGAAGVATWQLFGAELEARLNSQTSATSQEFAGLPETIAYRMGIWTRETVPAILERPVTGWGLDVYSAASKGWPSYPTQLSWGSPESEYLRTLITGGAVVLLAQVGLFIAVWLLIRASRRVAGRTVSVPLGTLFLGLLVLSVLHSHFANPGVPYAFWPIVGVCAGLIEVGRRHSPARLGDVKDLSEGEPFTQSQGPNPA